jgi:Tfp pilus assembly protein PilF
MKTAIRWILIVLLLGIVGFAAYATIKQYTFSADSQLAAGEKSYGEGLRAYDAKDYSKAGQRFDEAVLTARNVLGEFEKNRESLGDKSQEEIDMALATEGKAQWLLARGLKGQAFTRLALEGKNVSGETDPTSVEKSTGSLTQYNYRDITDETLRRESISALRRAAGRLPDELELQKEALLNETHPGVRGPLYWQAASQFANNVLRQDPTHKRALFLLARFEYEQPILNFERPETSTPAPLVKRSRDRVLKARAQLARLKEEEKPVRWPAVHLEAQIHQWLVNHYRRPEHSKPAEELKEELALRALLLDEETGALRRADQETRLTQLTRADLDAIMAVHIMAMEKVLEGTRRPGREPEQPNSERVLKVLDATMAMSKKLATREEDSPLQLADIVERAVVSMFKAQPFLANNHPEDWKRYLDLVQSLAQRVAQKNAGSPMLYRDLAELLAREAEAQKVKGQSNRQEELLGQALKWVDEGIRISQGRRDAKLVDITPLHEVAARRKILVTGKREDIAVHLKAMRESRIPSAMGLAAFLEGYLAEREGRLERARELLETAARLSPGETGRRAHLILANVYLALGQYDKAISSLREVDSLYADLQAQKLSDEEKKWLAQFIRSSGEAAYLQYQAHLASARIKYQYVVQEKPDDRVRDQLVRAIMAHEEAIMNLRKRLAKTPYYDTGRHALVAYLTVTDRAARARQELAELKAEKPDSVQVLRQEIQLLVMPPKGQVISDPRRLPNLDEADKRIRDFLGNYPQETSARLYYGQWLAQTGRAAEAAAYLSNRANFPDLDSNPRLRQVLAVLQLQLGEQDKVRQLVAELPSGQAKDRFEILLAANEAERNSKLMDAMTRHENNSVFRCYNASIALSKKDYVEAAKGFLSALEYSRVRDTARQGLATALVALAQDDPVKGREVSGQMLASYPNERGLLLGYAYACLMLDDLGNPDKPVDQISDMSSALTALELSAQRDGESVAYGALLKAQFWSQASRPDLARKEVQRALQKRPKHDGALLFAAQLALDSPEPDSLAAGQRHLDILKGTNPTSLPALLLQARVHEAGGRTADAVRTLEMLLESNPQLSVGYHNLVNLLEKSGQKPQAAKWITQWRTRLPEDILGAAAHVRQLAEAGNMAEAQKLADQAVEDEVKRVSAQLAHARTPRPLDPTDSDEQKQRILDNVRITGQVAMANAFKHAKAWNEAERWAHFIFKVRPDSIEGNLLLGEIYVARMRSEFWSFLRPLWVERAYEAYGKVYALQKGHIVAGNNLAWLLASEMNQPEKALTIAREVRMGQHSKKPLSGDRLPLELLDTFGAIHRNLEKPELNAEMRDLFQAAVTRYKSDPRMYLHLGRAYAGLKDKTKANDMFATAISMSKSRSTLPTAQRQSVIQEAEAEQKKLGLPSRGGPKPVQDP